jgi:predicted methyltransferase
LKINTNKSVVLNNNTEKNVGRAFADSLTRKKADNNSMTRLCIYFFMKDKQKFLAIGESDRMTIRFVKPLKAKK